ncbi:MAG: carbohydrate binding domain-containing protein [Planctomycetota bacterium]
MHVHPPTPISSGRRPAHVASGSPQNFTPSRQRGSVLILVLGVSAIVGVIGLSSLLAVRLQHRDVDARADAAQAAILADSALAVVHAQLSADPDWRSAHTHDTWSSPTNLGNGAMRYKLVDEGNDNDGDLADSDDDPARLVVRVAYGDAVRLASIQLGGGALLGPELTTNGDMEGGSSGYGISVIWGNVNGHSDSPHGGNIYLQLEGRSSQLVAIKQDLANDALESGRTYRVSAWLRLEDSPVDVKMGFLVSRGLTIEVVEQTQPGATEWANFTADLVPDFSFDPTTIYVYAVTATGSQDLHIDDLSVREVRSDALPVVHGSYRRELDG